MDSVQPTEHASSELTANCLPIGQACSASEQRVGSGVAARRAIRPRATEFYGTISQGLTARLLAEFQKSRYIGSGSYAQAVQPELAIRIRASGGKGKTDVRPLCTNFQKMRTVYEVSKSMEDVQALMVIIKAELDRLYHAAREGVAVSVGVELLPPLQAETKKKRHAGLRRGAAVHSNGLAVEAIQLRIAAQEEALQAA